MPGGDQAIREPWRMAVSHLRDAGHIRGEFVSRLPKGHLNAVEKMLERGFGTPMTSSMGRLFDAVAVLAGLCDRVSYEGQAAMELEWLAHDLAERGAYSFEVKEVPAAEAQEARLVVDTRPLIEDVARDAGSGTAGPIISRRFHTTIVELIASVCDHIRRSMRIDAVVLSGGVFMNALLSVEANRRLKDDGFRVFRHRLVPPNDGGLSLGQLAIAAALAEGACASGIGEEWETCAETG
jgi:hydrogenase maturation protein HypF